MPRASAASRKKNDGSHPQENRLEHRQFLVRSLERNDQDLAALEKLNASLRRLKSQIVTLCGEPVLLDLGTGRLTLIQDTLHFVSPKDDNNNNDENNNDDVNDNDEQQEDDGDDKEQQEKTEQVETETVKEPTTTEAEEETKDVPPTDTTTTPVPAPDTTTTTTTTTTSVVEDPDVYSLTPLQQQLCVDFLLRMKLRRKLSNRLVRRLNRIAQAMDGADVTPPVPPRYGDLRLQLDPAIVQQQSVIWKRQAEAKAAIASAKASKKQEQVQVQVQKAEEPKSLPAITSSSTTDAETKPESNVAATATTSTSTSTSADTTKPKEGEAPEETPSTATTAAAAASVTPTANGDAPPPTTTSTSETATPMEVDDNNNNNKDSEKDVSESNPTTEAPPPAPESAPDAVESTTTATTAKEADPKQDEDTPAPTTATATEKVVDDEDNKDKPKVTPAKEEEEEAAAATITTPKKESSSSIIPSPISELVEEYDFLKDYDDAYEKVWDRQSKEFVYAMTNTDTDTEQEELDYQKIKSGAAIGAQTRLLGEQEREQEYRRWQASVWARIPQQPTFDELGLANRVFCLESRRKRSLEEFKQDDDDQAEEATETETEESETKKAKVDEEEAEEEADVEMQDKEGELFEESNDNDDKKDAEDTTEDNAEGTTEEGSQDDDEAAAKTEEVEKKTIKLEPRKKKEDNDEDKQQQEEDEEAQKVLDEKTKRIRPMSLVAVPSFHEQDMGRIRTVHGDLLGTSILEHARGRMVSSTREYNNAFRISNQLFDHRARLQQNLAYFVTKSRTDLAKVNNDHALQVAMAKQRWMKEKQQHDANRIKQFLPSNWGRPAYGTTATQNFQRRGGPFSVIGACLADVVDGALIVAEGKLPNKKFNTFVPPPSPHVNKQTGESLAQQHMRMENELRRQINDCATKFVASEEERKRAWKKMMKTKAEIDLPTNNYGRRGRIDLSNYHQVPLPQLKSSTQQGLPHELAPRSAVASYQPPKPVDANDKKYSAARISEGMVADGAVTRVPEAKKTADGNYLRPAGMKRTGMQWDTARGIWIPEATKQ